MGKGWYENGKCHRCNDQPALRQSPRKKIEESNLEVSDGSDSEEKKR